MARGSRIAPVISSMPGPADLVLLQAAHLPQRLVVGVDDVHDAWVERLDEAERFLRHQRVVLLDAARLVPPDIGLHEKMQGFSFVLSLIMMIFAPSLMVLIFVLSQMAMIFALSLWVLFFPGSDGVEFCSHSGGVDFRSKSDAVPFCSQSDGVDSCSRSDGVDFCSQ